MRSLINQYINKRIFRKGYQHFLKSGETPEEAYYAMRKLFVATNGRFNDDFIDRCRNKSQVFEPTNSDTILNSNDYNDIDSIVNSIKKDGFYRFDTILNEKILAQLLNIGQTFECRYLEWNDEINRYGYSQNKIKFDVNEIISNRYQFDENELIKDSIVQKIMTDTAFLKIASSYIGIKPVLDLVTMWWSAPFEGKATNEAAQMYHFDMDRIKFIKFFIYLTDVDDQNGPHCYIKGSHKKLPKPLLRDGRFSDSEVEQCYDKSNFIELEGKAGSIFAVDTRGLHKGKELINGNRLIFQLEFSNSLFGQKNANISKVASKAPNPDVYSKYFINA